MNVMDARLAQAAGEVDLARSGFELLGESVGAGVDFLKHGNVVRDLYPECEQLLASATGAQAFAFDHNIRYASGKQTAQRIAGGRGGSCCGWQASTLSCCPGAFGFIC